MTVYATDAHAHTQTLVSLVKTATVVSKRRVIKEKGSVVHFLLAEGLNAKDILEEICPACGSLMDFRKLRMMKRRCESGSKNSPKTFMLPVLTQW
jgi:hypothetical protein